MSKAKSTKSSKTKATAKASRRKTAKKATKKTASQATKRAARKRVTRSSKTSSATSNKPKVLVCASGQECFWTTDGQVLKDLRELSESLETMADEVFSYHVNKERNDFADWVDVVLADAECAAALRRSRKPSSARTVVVRHLKTYSL